jgi:pantothenate kinase
MKQLPKSIVIPMDGYHYTKEYLNTMPNPSLAFARRGADWTFDSERFVNDLRTSHQNKSGFFPSFDHSHGDPIEQDIELKCDHQFVIVEGLYLLLSKEPWNQIRSIVDVSIFIDCPEEILKSRLISRHMEAFQMSREKAEERVVSNDLPNAAEVLASKDRADIILSNE